MSGAHDATFLFMTVVLGHSSAWQYWLHAGNPERQADITRVYPYARQDDVCGHVFARYSPRLDDSTLKELGSIGLSPKGLHVIVSDEDNKRKLVGVNCHLHSSWIPQDAILRVSEHVFVASPEFTFLHKACERKCSLERLIMYGYGVCSRFAYTSPYVGNRELVQIEERTTVERIRGFLDSIARSRVPGGNNPNGLKRAGQALKHVLGSVESPQEARIAMLEFLCARLGGEAVLSPECNGVVKLSEESMRITGRRKFRCDFLWRDEKVVLEYNGSQHGNPRDVTRDVEKYNALRDAGYSVILASNEHVKDPAHTEALADQLRHVLRQRKPYRNYDYAARKQNLRREIGL